MGSRRWVAVVVCAVACAACSSPAPTSGGPATSAASGTTTTSGTGVDGCAPAGSTTTSVTIGTAKADVVVEGSGATTVLLNNQSDENLCAWLPYATTLTQAGYRVALWDYASTSGQPIWDQCGAVVAALRQSGAAKVVLFGASQGAKTALVTADKHPEGVVAVVSLSAELTLPNAYVPQSVGDVKVPVLMVTATEDGYGAATAGPQILAALPGPDKKLLTVPGMDHGTALLAGTSGQTVTPAVMDFLKRVAPPG